MSSAYLCSVSIREKSVSLLRVDERKERQRITSKNRNAAGSIYVVPCLEKTLNSTNRAVAVATFGCPNGILPHVIAGYGMRFSSPSTPDVFEVLSGLRSLLYVLEVKNKFNSYKTAFRDRPRACASYGVSAGKHL